MNFLNFQKKSLSAYDNYHNKKFLFNLTCKQSKLFKVDTSIFLARFWGWYLLIFFIILTFKPIRIKQIFADLRDQKFLIISAFLAIILGLVSVLLHNIWEPSWKFIITAIGWTSLFLGLALFIFPHPTSRRLETINVKFVQVIYVMLFLAGLYLLNIGYGILLY